MPGPGTPYELDSYNNRYDEGGEIREFYDTYRTYAMWDENKELELAVTISSDTATGEVHFIAVNSHNEASNQAAVQMMTALADLAAGQEGTLSENELSDALDSLEYVEKPEYNYYIFADIYIGEDSAYSLQIGRCTTGMRRKEISYETNLADSHRGNHRLCPDGERTGSRLHGGGTVKLYSRSRKIL